MENVHILPTDKETRLFTSDSELVLAGYPATTFKTGRNIYITSDEEIKVGDWYFSIDKFIRKANIIWDNLYGENPNKKIILTTDQDLIKDGVQAIDDEFLEWFIKNPSCEDVKVEKKFKANPKYKEGTQLTEKVGYWKCKIIIPKEETKQDWYCPKCKSYVSSESVTFEETHQLCNTSVIIKEAKQENDYTALLQPVGTKQETLEEFIESYINRIDRSEDGLVRQCIVDAVKWQKQKDSNWFNEYQDVENYIINKLGDKFLEATPEKYETASEATIALLESNWQQQTMPIHILDVENTLVRIENGNIIVEKNNKTIKSYSDEEVESILIEYVRTNPTKPYRVLSWFREFKRKIRL